MGQFRKIGGPEYRPPINVNPINYRDPKKSTLNFGKTLYIYVYVYVYVYTYI